MTTTPFTIRAIMILAETDATSKTNAPRFFYMDGVRNGLAFLIKRASFVKRVLAPKHQLGRKWLRKHLLYSLSTSIGDAGFISRCALTERQLAPRRPRQDRNQVAKPVSPVNFF
jgi:hypothetical protein